MANDYDIVSVGSVVEALLTKAKNAEVVHSTNIDEQINGVKTFLKFPKIPAKQGDPQQTLAGAQEIASEYQVAVLKNRIDTAFPSTGGTVTGNLVVNGDTNLKGTVILGDEATDIITITGKINDVSLAQPKLRQLQDFDYLYATEKQAFDAINILKQYTIDKYVSIDSVQSITGVKTFSNAPLIPPKFIVDDTFKNERLPATEAQLHYVWKSMAPKSGGETEAFTGDVYFDKSIVVKGNTTLGDASGDYVNILGYLSTDLKLGGGGKNSLPINDSSRYATEAQLYTVAQIANNALIKNIGGTITAPIHINSQFTVNGAVTLGANDLDRLILNGSVNDLLLYDQKSSSIYQNYVRYATEGQVYDAINNTGVFPNGTITTASIDPNKRVTLVNGHYILQAGQVVFVKLLLGNTAGNPTLSINNGPALPVFFNGGQVGKKWIMGQWVLLCTGSAWNIIASDQFVSINADEVIYGQKTFEKDVQLSVPKDYSVLSSTSSPIKYATEKQVWNALLGDDPIYVVGLKHRGLPFGEDSDRIYGTDAFGHDISYALSSIGSVKDVQLDDVSVVNAAGIAKISTALFGNVKTVYVDSISVVDQQGNANISTDGLVHRLGNETIDGEKQFFSDLKLIFGKASIPDKSKVDRYATEAQVYEQTRPYLVLDDWY